MTWGFSIQRETSPSGLQSSVYFPVTGSMYAKIMTTTLLPGVAISFSERRRTTADAILVPEGQPGMVVIIDKVNAGKVR